MSQSLLAPASLRYVAKITRGQGFDADDARQEAALAVLQGASTFTEVRSRVVDARRLLWTRERIRESSRHVALDASIPEATRMPDEALDEASAIARMRPALDAIDARLRHVIHRQYFDGASRGEIAAELCVHPSRVSQLRVAALREIAEKMSLR